MSGRRESSFAGEGTSGHEFTTKNTKNTKKGLGYFGRVHRDEGGAISVLVLLTIWCLVAVLGMLWNTAEEARHRALVQTAADAAAQSAATWMARSVNMVAAQNMILCQDASAETLVIATGRTYNGVKQRLEQELLDIQRLRGANPLVPVGRNLVARRAAVAAEYQLASRALASVINLRGNDLYYADAQEKRGFIQASDSALAFLNSANQVVVTQLDPILANLQGNQLQTVNTAILDRIEQTIRNAELPPNEAFRARTLPAAGAIPGLQAHRRQVWSDQQAVVEALPGSVEETRQQLEGYYKTDITLATLRERGFLGGQGDSATVQAPLMPASAVASQTQVDTIRTNPAYFQEAIDLGLPLTVTIDPINPHTWDHVPGQVNDHSRDNRIWFPDLRAQVPAGYRAQYRGLQQSYVVRCMPSAETGWGELWAAPLERYYHDRSGRDSSTLGEDYMQPIDAAREELARWIRTQIQSSLGVDEAVLDAILAGLPTVVNLTAPTNADAAFRAQVDLYNQHAGAYLGEIRTLVNVLRSYTSIYDRFTRPFAVDRWHAERDYARRVVVRELGNGKEFMILSSYVLQPVPAWARETMRVSVATRVEDEITRLNMLRVTQDLMNSGAPPGIAAQIADELIRPVAAAAAEAIANEWMNRPWPYEFVPPERPVPPSRGIGERDRKQYFTVMAGARQRAGTGPRLLLPTIFGSDSTTLAAYAQGEMHDWFEFDQGHGGGETFDQVVNTPWGGVRFTRYGLFVANPRHWRAGTVAGWNWRARLTLSDALAEMVEGNSELRGYLEGAGVTGFDRGALEVLNGH